MKSVLNYFFARTHSLAYTIVICLQAAITASTNMVLIPFIAAVVACVFVQFIEDVNTEVQKEGRK